MSKQHIDWKIRSDNWQKFCQLHIDENARLKAEVERLRKAGDAMVELLDHMDVVMDMNSDHPEVEAWKAAKEGKQS